MWTALLFLLSPLYGLSATVVDEDYTENFVTKLFTGALILLVTLGGLAYLLTKVGFWSLVAGVFRDTLKVIGSAFGLGGGGR